MNRKFDLISSTAGLQLELDGVKNTARELGHMITNIDIQHAFDLAMLEVNPDALEAEYIEDQLPQVIEWMNELLAEAVEEHGGIVTGVITAAGRAICTAIMNGELEAEHNAE